MQEQPRNETNPNQVDVEVLIENTVDSPFSEDDLRAAWQLLLENPDLVEDLYARQVLTDGGRYTIDGQDMHVEDLGDFLTARLKFKEKREIEKRSPNSVQAASVIHHHPGLDKVDDRVVLH